MAKKYLYKKNKKRPNRATRRRQQSRAATAVAGKDAEGIIQLCLGFCRINDWILFFCSLVFSPAFSAAPSRHRNADGPLLFFSTALPKEIKQRIYQFAVRVIHSRDKLIQAVDEYHTVPPPLPRSGRRRHRGAGCLPPPQYRRMSKWDVSRVDDFSGVFDQTRNDQMWQHVRYEDLSGWDVSSGTNFSYMFRGCNTFRGGTVLSRWNVARGTNFKGMFEDCTVFQGDLPNGMYHMVQISVACLLAAFLSRGTCHYGMYPPVLIFSACSTCVWPSTRTCQSGMSHGALTLVACLQTAVLFRGTSCGGMYRQVLNLTTCSTNVRPSTRTCRSGMSPGRSIQWHVSFLQFFSGGRLAVECIGRY
jgi:Mycoplasma protein of unknown function, DUF285